MPTMTTTDHPVRVYSHFTTLKYDGQVEKEEVFLTFAATWRGEDALVTMSCDRYRYASDEMGPWRVYASDARKQDDAGRYGPHLTDTARRRLSEGHADAARAWLASEDYAASYRAAIASAIVQSLRHARVYDSTPAKDARRQLATHTADLPTATVERLTAACDALDTFGGLVTGEGFA